MRAWSFRRSSTDTETVARDEIASVAADSGSLLWVDVTNPTDDDITFLVEALKIHDLTAEDLARGNQRTKLDRFADHFHVALYDAELHHDLTVLGGHLGASEDHDRVVKAQQATDHDAPGVPHRAPMDLEPHLEPIARGPELQPPCSTVAARPRSHHSRRRC